VDKEPSYEDSQLSAGNIKVPVGAERFKIMNKQKKYIERPEPSE
jgi:hypothetical protein